MKEDLSMTEWGVGFCVGVMAATCIISVINMGIWLLLDNLREQRRNRNS